MLFQYLQSGINKASFVVEKNVDSRNAANKKLAIKMVWVVAGSLLFAFAMVPLYNVLCSVTGLNGKSDYLATNASKAIVDNNRLITVQFVSDVMPGLGWNFEAKQSAITMHPGQIETVMYVVKNTTNQASTGRAIHSVTPGKAAKYFKKIECFCFKNQALKPGESKEMPLRFFISNDLPEDVKEMTLSYAFYKADEK
jgi:cytochrome c oxidase assembly protein subunit 11